MEKRLILRVKLCLNRQQEIIFDQSNESTICSMYRSLLQCLAKSAVSYPPTYHLCRRPMPGLQQRRRRVLVAQHH